MPLLIAEEVAQGVAVFAEMTVSLTEDDANDLANAEEPDALRERILAARLDADW